MRIAVDAMGGDVGPAVTVQGALDAARDYELDVTLVGDQATIERELAHRKGYAAARGRITAPGPAIRR